MGLEGGRSVLKRSTVAVLLAVTLASGWGCSEAGPGAADAEAKAQIASKLDAANIAGIVVTVQDGVATLTGSAPDQATADRAGQLARETAGVKTVLNQIAVGGGGGVAGVDVPPPPAVTTKDEVLAAAVNLRLASNAALAGSKITVTAAGGVATLAGTVPSDAAKAAAETVAKSVPGVTSVANNLTVVAAAPVETVPDVKIADDVNALLDKQFFELIVNVEVKGGAVTLSGAVPNRGTIVQVTNAVQQIKGVKAVDTSRLTVQGGEPDDERIGAPAKKP
jgi:hyperosmotically inducible protein